jgi:hypothetical protein
MMACNVADLCHSGVDPDPDSAIFVTDLQDAKKLILKKVSLLITF